MTEHDFKALLAAMVDSFADGKVKVHQDQIDSVLDNGTELIVHKQTDGWYTLEAVTL